MPDPDEFAWLDDCEDILTDWHGMRSDGQDHDEPTPNGWVTTEGDT